MSLQSERPHLHDFGYSSYLIVNAEDFSVALTERIDECQRRANASQHPTAKAEWLRHIKDLRALTAEGE
jgi:hypothetical protein